MYARDILGDHRRSHCRPKGTESKVPQSQQLLTPRIAYQVMAGILLAFHSLIEVMITESAFHQLGIGAFLESLERTL